jgi:hypothetical protein
MALRAPARRLRERGRLGQPSTGFSNGGVTVRHETASMQRHRSPAAVCILRVEVESWGVVFTMTVNRDLATSTAEPVTRFSNAGDAVAAVAEFLESFTPDKPT